MTSPDNPSEYREAMIVLHPGEPPVKARARITCGQPPPPPGVPSVPNR